MKTILISGVTFLMFLSLQSNSANAQCCVRPGSGISTASVHNLQDKVKTVQIKVTGMTCGGCASHVYKALAATEGVIDNEVKYPGDVAIVKYNPNKIKPEQLVKVIEEKTSYKAELIKEEKKDKSKT